MMDENDKKKLVTPFLAIQSRQLINVLLLVINLTNICVIMRNRQRHARKRCQIWRFPRPQFWFQDMLNNPAQRQLWKTHFRIERSTFDFICDVVRGDVQKQETHMGKTYSVEERVGCALWRLATGDSYRSCTSVFGMGKSTAIAILNQFLKAMRKHKNRFIKFPVTKEDVRVKIEEVKCLSKFPNVVAAIDGCHIEIP